MFLFDLGAKLMAHYDTFILPLHKHIDMFNRSITLANDLTNSGNLYVNCVSNQEGHLHPVTYSTSKTYVVVEKPTRHKYLGGRKARKDFYIDELHRDCIYILYRDDELVYVGQSKNVYNRLNQHKRDKVFDRVRVLHCREDRKLYWEKILINSYKPIYNRNK
tara:strand:+ start:44 stop:529 length:486 start_codon:yes stop_codon:yes gene_type:complete